MTAETSKNWIDDLSEEDVAFIKRFVLNSGSLKEMAKLYGVTYPTIRLRLDRLIAKVEALDEDIPSKFEKALRVKYAEGKIDYDTLKELLRLHKNEKGSRS
jgi:hypothetical protein